jgi:hypothetical protein
MEMRVVLDDYQLMNAQPVPHFNIPMLRKEARFPTSIVVLDDYQLMNAQPVP